MRATNGRYKQFKDDEKTMTNCSKKLMRFQKLANLSKNDCKKNIELDIAHAWSKVT